MNRVSRMSAKVVAVLAHIDCPGCGHYVLPDGEVCPDCGFPISRFLLRKKWVRLFAWGAAIFGIAVAVQILSILSDLRGPFGWALNALTIMGFGILAVGALGILFGGAHSEGQERQSSGWTRPPEKK